MKGTINEEYLLKLRKLGAIAELEKVKAEMGIIHDRYKINFQGYSMSVAKECIDIIDKHIEELKG